VAGVAGLVGRDPDLRVLAVRGFLERDLHRVVQIGAAEHLLAARATALATLPAEDVAEDVAEGLGKPSETFCARGAAGTHVRVDAGVAELVVGGALLRVREHLVGLLRLLELLLGLRVVRIAVRMEFHGQLAVGLLDLFFGSVAIDAEDFVIVAFSHGCLDKSTRAAAAEKLAGGPFDACCWQLTSCR